MKIISLLALTASLAFGSTNLYISPSGSDSTGNGTQATPYATLGKALSTVASPLTDSVVVNASGTFAEGIDVSHFVMDGAKSLTISGGTFTGSLPCSYEALTGAFDPNVSSAVCAVGPVSLILKNLTIAATANTGVGCSESVCVLDGVTVTGSTATAVGVNHARLNIRHNVTLSNCSSFCLYLSHLATAQQDVIGTLTITGTSLQTSLGIVEEFTSVYAILASGPTNVTISNVNSAIVLTSTSSFNSFVSTGTVNVSNATLSPGQGIYTTASSSFNLSGTGLVVSNFQTCLWAYALSIIDQGPGNRYLGCPSYWNAAQGSQIVVF